MDTAVCVLTARGMSAIASVALSGPDAQMILNEIFQRGNPLSPSEDCPLTGGEFNRVAADRRSCKGDVLYGSIVEGHRVIDEVLVGCEGPDAFVIHCHGNPLLVEQVVRLCQSKGATLVDAESYALQQSTANAQNTIEAEAKPAMQKSATLSGVKILQGQIDGGLSKWAAELQTHMDLLDIADIHKQSAVILDRSRIAKRIITGVRIVIAGPPNSGKSTLLNCLSGRGEAIVSDTAGTTRDWISVTCHMGPLRAEFIDTAGLDETLACRDDIEQTAQEITKQLLESCDLIVYLQDARSADWQVEIDMAKPVVFVANKCDLVQELKNSRTQELKSVRVSAKNNTGIDKLVESILAALQADAITPAEPVVFTSRQQNILSQLASAEDTAAVCLLINRLLSDPVA